MAKYVIKNVHSKAVMLPGGMLPPGNTRIIDLDDPTAHVLEQSPFLKMKKELKNKVKKKAVKKKEI